MLAEGVRYIGFTLFSHAKKYPPCAIANGTLDPDRIDPLIAAKIETIAAALTNFPPADPTTRRIISAATRSVPATSAALNTVKYAQFATKYIPIVISVPKISALGRFRSGLLISEPSIPALFQPSNAQSAATSAAKNPADPDSSGVIAL